MPGPLEGIKIIEFAGLGPGPFCGMMLADHGAEVVRIERLGAQGLIGDARKDFLNRGRKTIEIDLKSATGLKLARDLCRSADGLIEGFRPGVMERLGLGPDLLRSENPSLVYGRMTGWGQDGPYAQMAGHDINYIALTGALHAIGRAGEGPVPPMNIIGDFGGGGMFLAFGMVAALLQSQLTGEGQVVDCAMTDGSAVLMSMMYSLHAQALWNDDRGTNIFDSGSHFYDTYETADGLHIAIGAIEPQFYAELIERLGLSDDPALQSQHDTNDWPHLKQKIADRVRVKTRAEWEEIFEGSNACVAPVLSLTEAPRHRHNAVRRTFLDVDGHAQPAPAPRFSASPDAVPRKGQDGREACLSILTDLGIQEADIERMITEQIVA